MSTIQNVVRSLLSSTSSSSLSSLNHRTSGLKKLLPISGFNDRTLLQTRFLNHSLVAIRSFTSNGYNPVKTMTLRTCVGTYDRLRKVDPKFYKNAPSEGIDITIDYLDNLGPNIRSEKTIVGIHGVPGNYTHFDPIPQYFAKKNVRVIVPNMPNFADTRRTKAFWHSTEEKCQFLKDFLKKLNVKKIDCLISHSFGIQTASQFWDQCNEVEINSFGFFSPNPTGFFENPKEFSGGELVFLFKSEWWYKFLDYMKVHKRGLIPMRLENVNEFLLMASAGIEKQSPVELPKRIDILVNSDKPIVLLYGSRDRLISKRSINTLRELLGIPVEDIVEIDKEKDSPEEKVRMDKRIMYYNLKDGGHFAHANFHPYTIRMIENLLEYQEKQKTT